MPQSEAKTQRDIVNELVKHGWGVIRLNSMQARTPSGAMVTSYICYPGELTAGASDLLAMRDHRVVPIEVKAQRGAVRLTQKNFAKWAAWTGTDVVVARSIDDVEHLLNPRSILLEDDQPTHGIVEVKRLLKSVMIKGSDGARLFVSPALIPGLIASLREVTHA